MKIQIFYFWNVELLAEVRNVCLKYHKLFTWIKICVWFCRFQCLAQCTCFFSFEWEFAMHCTTQDNFFTHKSGLWGTWFWSYYVIPDYEWLNLDMLKNTVTHISNVVEHVYWMGNHTLYICSCILVLYIYDVHMTLHNYYKSHNTTCSFFIPSVSRVVTLVLNFFQMKITTC